MSDTTGRIRIAAAIVAVGVLLSRVLGFGRTIVLATILGDTAVADAYENAFILPDILNYLLAGGFLAITFIPILSERIAEGVENEDQARILGERGCEELQGYLISRAVSPDEFERFLVPEKPDEEPV